MPRLTKKQLLSKVEEGFHAGEWELLYLSEPGEHPARYRVYRESDSLTVRIYVWNISHGGGAARAVDEFRIQVTGLETNRFEPEIGGKTIILGWWDTDEVFAGFDFRRHRSTLGSSPSLQVKQSCLHSASIHRFASYPKGNDETVVAFRPEFIGAYAKNLEDLHDTGHAPNEMRLLERIVERPDTNLNGEIDARVAQPRRVAIYETKRALRALDFGARILSAYEHRCAMCGMQLRLIDGAHILPVADPESTDETSNGIALCATHHRAYDRSLITFRPDYQIILNEKKIRELRAAEMAAGIGKFRENLKSVIRVPAERSSQPKREYVEKANARRGWQ